MVALSTHTPAADADFQSHDCMLASAGTRVSGEDIIVGKTTALPEPTDGTVAKYTKKDASLALRNAESGVVDQVRG